MKHVKYTIEEIALLSKTKKLVCFGAGKYLENIFFDSRLEHLHFENIIDFIIDNDEKKHNTFFEIRNTKIPIFSVDKVKYDSQDILIVITAKKNINDMIVQLVELDLPYVDFVVWNDIIDLYKENCEIPKIINGNLKKNRIIPKTIHYCWVGGKELPEKEKYCIESWKKNCPDYEIILWNEDNFDISCNQYVYEAYNNKKYAFVSDYIRLWCVYNYGGIYLDSDVEVLKNLDAFLVHKAFSGFESRFYYPTGIMGGEKNSVWFEYLLSYYNDRHFVGDDGKFDMTTNTVTITRMSNQRYGKELTNGYIDLDEVVLYPQEVFCPFTWDMSDKKSTENTYCIHWFSGSWNKK